MSKIDYQALREAAEKAGEDKWQAKKINGDFFVIRHGSYTRQHGYTSYQPIAEIDCKPVRDFVAKANPATVLELLDELEAAKQRIAELEGNRAALAAENARLKAICEDRRTFIMNGVQLGFIKVPTVEIDPALETIRIALSPQKTTPATDTFLDEVKTEARKEGAYFVANRMLAAWEAGFIDDTAKNAADIARMILTSTEFMANAREGDFDRSFSDGVLEDIADQLRKGGKQ
ncbi:ead/Ea22-like family protein [Escherichia coli]|nr:ead/Ea22-like family protein [Escherichia coli]EEV0506870.1 ead/Ea22-like family protein [Escherichia coli]EIF0440499.1 ead/Ea22-like family protein [Escherichia coli]